MSRKARRMRLYLLLIILVLIGFSFFFFQPTNPFTLPIKYKDFIREAAAKYEVDPFIIAAVIHTESSWDRQAVSPVGARGLMQIMPETAEYLAQRRSENLDLEDLFDPRINIDYGTYYLKDLYETFKDWKLTYAAYNAGPNRVQGWLDEGQISKRNLEAIPFEETRNYVQRVDQMRKAYKKKYSRFPK